MDLCKDRKGQGILEMMWEYIVAILGGIVLIGNAGAAIYKWIAPALKIKKTVEEVDRRTNQDYEALKKIQSSLDRIEKQQRGIIVSEVAILNHMIDGNNIVKMQETRDRIQDMLIEEK